jgi:hypothetical protein
MKPLPGYEDTGIIVSEPGIQCGCSEERAACEEGKRLEEICTARYRACAGVYNQRESRRLATLWREACDAYMQHLKDNHRD